MKNSKKIIVTIFTAFCLLLPLAPVGAVSSSSPILPNCVASHDINVLFSAECRSINTFVELAINIGAFAFSIVGALALGALVYGGFMLIISGGSAEKVKKGWDAIVAAAIGLVVTFGGYILIQFLVTSIGLQSGFSLIK
ncbi:MAG: hypothetical protein WCX97_04580 [Candidatus Magasanikbacteria bacterium]